MSSGVFESILVSDGRLIRAAEHLARLAASCRTLWSEPLPDGLVEHAGRAAAATGAGRHALRLAARPGPDGVSVRVSTRTLGPPPRRTPIRYAERRDRDWSHKWLDRAELTAAEHGCAPSVPYFCAPDGAVAETSRGNLFVRAAGAAHWSTPPTGRSLLPGVTRAALVDVLAERDEVRVERVGIEALRTAELVLWTSSLSGVVAVSSVDGRPLRIDEDLRAGLAQALETGC